VKQEPPHNILSTDHLQLEGSPELDEKISQQNVKLIRQNPNRPENPTSKSKNLFEKEKDPTKTKFRVRLRVRKLKPYLNLIAIRKKHQKSQIHQDKEEDSLLSPSHYGK